MNLIFILRDPEGGPERGPEGGPEGGPDGGPDEGGPAFVPSPVYSLYRARKELDRLDSAVKCINLSDVNIESKSLILLLGIQLSADIIFTAYSLYRGTVRVGRSETVLFSSI